MNCHNCEELKHFIQDCTKYCFNNYCINDYEKQCDTVSHKIECKTKHCVQKMIEYNNNDDSNSESSNSEIEYINMLLSI